MCRKTKSFLAEKNSPISFFTNSEFTFPEFETEYISVKSFSNCSNLNILKNLI